MNKNLSRDIRGLWAAKEKSAERGLPTLILCLVVSIAKVVQSQTFFHFLLFKLRRTFLLRFHKSVRTCLRCSERSRFFFHDIGWRFHLVVLVTDGFWIASSCQRQKVRN